MHAGPNPGPGGSWNDRQQRKVDQQIVLAIGESPGGWRCASGVNPYKHMRPPACLSTRTRLRSLAPSSGRGPAGLGLTVLVVLGLRLGVDAFQSADATPFELGDLSLGPGDALGALLWAGALYYCNPLQLILLFFGERLAGVGGRARGGCMRRFGASRCCQLPLLVLCAAAQWSMSDGSPPPATHPPHPTPHPPPGFIETERPSDWVLQRLGLAAGLDVDAIDYRAPAPIVAATVALFGALGAAVAVALQAGLGDATWAVSGGEPCLAAV